MVASRSRATCWLNVPGSRVLVLSLMGALSGCAVGGPLVAPPGPAPVSQPTQQLTAADGTALAVSEWPADAPADQPRAVILAVHGYGDYGPSTFNPAAEFWAKQGITTYAYDQRGFGRNASFGHWPGAEALVADVQAVTRQIRARHPCLPVIVAGHSMGGGVVLAAARELDADGLILAAPAIWGGAEMNPLHRLAAWSAAAVVPERRFTGEGIIRIQASDNIELLRALGRDPRYLRPPSAREIFGLVRISDMAEAAAQAVSLPALLLLGEKDEIVPVERVRRVFARLTGPRQVIAYPEGWHLLFRDLQAERVWRDVADWTRSAAPLRPSCAAPSG